jgi:hypothetical protein
VTKTHEASTPRRLARLSPHSSTVAPASPPYAARRRHGERQTGAGSRPQTSPARPRPSHRTAGHTRNTGRLTAPASGTVPAHPRTQPD